MKRKHPREHDSKHLDFIRALPCCVCLNPIETEAAHVRYSDAMAAKFNPGVSAKPHDRWTVPLCGKHHREQHDTGNERAYWRSVGINPLYLSLVLYSISGDHDAGPMVVVTHYHMSGRTATNV